MKGNKMTKKINVTVNTLTATIAMLEDLTATLCILQDENAKNKQISVICLKIQPVIEDARQKLEEFYTN